MYFDYNIIGLYIKRKTIAHIRKTQAQEEEEKKFFIIQLININKTDRIIIKEKQKSRIKIKLKDTLSITMG